MVQYADGSVGTGIQMRLCQELCRTSWVAEDGSFAFAQLPPGAHSFEAVVMGKQEAYATPLSPITLELDEVRSLDEILIVPEFVTLEEFSSASSLIGDGGLTVDVDPEGFAVNAAKSPSSSVYLATVAVDPNTSGLPIEGLEGTPVAMWYLGNFDSHADPVWPFSVNNPDLNLTEGTQLNIYGADYGNKEWKPSGTATVDAEGVIHTDTDSGISLLTTLILVQP